tara:strand:- start:2744 stop:3655 length:912 start_codon:yes stop_codon:yes gene_type:complete
VNNIKDKIIGSMVAIATPMNENDEVDYQALEKLLEFHIKNKTDVIVSVGTTGESATLDFSEHEKVIKTTIDIINGRVPVIAGTGANSTSEAIELTRKARDIGADACLLVTPYYNKPTQNGLYEHYMKIADTVDIPQILYNVPGRTSLDMLPDTVLKLSNHENIIGIKEASGSEERSRELLKKCSHNISIISGDDKTSMRDMLMGFKGNISVTANVAPNQMHLMCKHAINGDKNKAEEINNQVDILHDKLFLESNPIPVKWVLQKLGLIGKGIRLPLTQLDEQYHDEIMNAIKSSKLRENNIYD